MHDKETENLEATNIEPHWTRPKTEEAPKMELRERDTSEGVKLDIETKEKAEKNHEEEERPNWARKAVGVALIAAGAVLLFG